MNNHHHFSDQQVYDKLPTVLKKACSAFKEPHIRDMYLIAQLGLLSACFPSLHGVYHSKKQYPNLFAFIIARAGTGKSVITFARKAIEKIVNEFNNKDVSDTGYQPDGEFSRSLIISGNISASALMSQLKSNKGVGIVFETEADTLSNSIAQDWGNYSDIMRKAFHHEPLSLKRKKNFEDIYIDAPKLSFVLSGTPDQVRKLIPSAENGLFSRFLYHNFDGVIEFKDGRPSIDTPDLDPFFDSISEDFLVVYNSFKDRDVFINLTGDQWDLLFNYWKETFNNYISDHEELSSVVFRYALMTYRIAIILTALRAVELDEQTENSLLCKQEDYYASINIMYTIFNHAVQVYQSLPNKSGSLDHRLINLFNKLPTNTELSRKQILDIWNMNERSSTADYKIKKLKDEGYLISGAYGCYTVNIQYRKVG